MCFFVPFILNYNILLSLAILKGLLVDVQWLENIKIKEFLWRSKPSLIFHLNIEFIRLILFKSHNVSRGSDWIANITIWFDKSSNFELWCSSFIWTRFHCRWQPETYLCCHLIPIYLNPDMAWGAPKLDLLFRDSDFPWCRKTELRCRTCDSWPLKSIDCTSEARWDRELDIMTWI